MGPVGQTTAATSYAGALVILILFILQLCRVPPVPDNVSAAMVMLLTPFVHAAALWFTKEEDAAPAPIPVPVPQPAPAPAPAPAPTPEHP